MATANQQVAKKEEPKKEEKELTYKPLGEDREISLSVSMTKRFLIKPTRNGAQPGNDDVIRFMMLCQARELNPWAGDAYCVGFDGDKGPEFSLITAVQALEKRAEHNPAYDGMEHGIILRRADGTTEFREGTFWTPDEILVGGWAKVYRKDRSHPEFVSLQLTAFNKGRSLWKTDPAGMIDKCARAGALRHSFPTQTGGLYLEEEIEGRVTTLDVGEMPQTTSSSPRGLDSLSDQLLGKPQPVIEAPKPHVVPPRETVAPPAQELPDKPMRNKRGRSQPARPVAEPEQSPAPVSAPVPVQAAPAVATEPAIPVQPATAAAAEQLPWEGDQEPVDDLDVQDWSELVDAFKAQYVPGNPDVDVLGNFIDTARGILMTPGEGDKAAKIVGLRGVMQAELETAWGNYALGELTKRALSKAF